MKRSVAAFVMVLSACGEGQVSTPPPTTPSSVSSSSTSPDTAWLPKGFAVEDVYRTDQADLRLRLTARGRPVLLRKDTLVPLRAASDEKDALPVRLGVPRVDDAVWMEDGALLVVSGKELSVATPAGAVTLGELPSLEMHVAAAGPEGCWLFGGQGPVAEHLFFVGRRGEMRHVLHMPKPIRAVAGKPEAFYVAQDGMVARLREGQPPEVVFASDDPVSSLAIAPGIGIFVSTTRGLDVLYETGTVAKLLGMPVRELAVHGDELFAVIEGHGIIRGRPLSAFKAVDRAGAPR